MKIGILQTDGVRPGLLDSFGDYPAMFQLLFKQVAPAIDFAVYDVQVGQYPKQIDACDAYIITGSKASVYDTAAWIRPLFDFIIELDRQQKKLVAVCFGHQLVAEAFGGKTEKSNYGWGVGVHTVQVYVTKPWMKPAMPAVNVVVSHQDQVTRLPDGAELIAGNAFCAHSMFQMGEHILTIQGHPEFSKDYAKAMMQHRANKQKIDQQTLKTGLQSLSKPVDALTIAKWCVAFMAGR